MEAADPIADDWKFAGSRTSRFNSAPESSCRSYPGSPAFSRRSCNACRLSTSRYRSFVMNFAVVREGFPAMASPTNFAPRLDG
jgi:hypothetical protein